MMPNVDNSITKRQLTSLALTGLVILGLFVAGFIWLVYFVRVAGESGGELSLAYAPFWIFPYLAVGSLYVGFFVARVAQGGGQHPWLWGSVGFVLTLLSLLGLPSLLSPLFPYPSPEIFAGPAIFAFLAPVLAALFMVWFISLRTKAKA